MEDAVSAVRDVIHLAHTAGSLAAKDLAYAAEAEVEAWEQMIAEAQEGLRYIASFRHAAPCEPCGSMGCLAGRKAQQILDRMSE